MLTKDLLGNWLFDKGYTRDRFGHYQRTDGETTYRFKMLANSVRYEKQIYVVDKNEWMRIMSGYYKNLSITSEGKIAGMKR